MFKKHNRKKSDWTITEINLLEQLYIKKGMKINDIAKKLPYRSKNAIAIRINLCGFSKWKKNEWSEHELNILMNHYQGTEIKKLMKLLPGRNSDSIKVKAAKLKLRKDTQRKWTKLEENYLIKNYKTTSYKQLSIDIGASIAAVEGKIDDLIRKGKIENKFKKWTQKEVEVLVKLYKATPYHKISILLNRTVSSINHKIKKLKNNKIIE